MHAVYHHAIEYHVARNVRAANFRLNDDAVKRHT